MREYTASARRITADEIFGPRLGVHVHMTSSRAKPLTRIARQYPPHRILFQIRNGERLGGSADPPLSETLRLVRVQWESPFMSRLRRLGLERQNSGVRSQKSEVRSQEPESIRSAFCCALPAFRFVLTSRVFLPDQKQLLAGQNVSGSPTSGVFAKRQSRSMGRGECGAKARRGDTWKGTRAANRMPT
jgi:hypothetical protein